MLSVTTRGQINEQDPAIWVQSQLASVDELIEKAGNVFLRKGMNAGGTGFVHAEETVKVLGRKGSFAGGSVCAEKGC